MFKKYALLNKNLIGSRIVTFHLKYTNKSYFRLGIIVGSSSRDLGDLRIKWDGLKSISTVNIRYIKSLEALLKGEV